MWRYFLFLIANNWAMYTEPVSRLLLCYLNIFYREYTKETAINRGLQLSSASVCILETILRAWLCIFNYSSCSGSDLMKMWGVGKGVMCFFLEKRKRTRGTSSSISRPTVQWTAGFNFQDNKTQSATCCRPVLYTLSNRAYVTFH